MLANTLRTYHIGMLESRTGRVAIRLIEREDSSMATFSKRHYILLAEALRTARARNAALPETVAGIDKATNFIASALSEDNDRFNYAHFTAVVRGEREIGSRVPRDRRDYGN